VREWGGRGIEGGHVNMGEGVVRVGGLRSESDIPFLLHLGHHDSYLDAATLSAQSQESLDASPA